jgi:predicted O-methyltransferase YrrM
MPQKGAASRKIANMTRRAIHNPSWLGETIRGKARARSRRNRGFDLAARSEHLCSVVEALGQAFGVSVEDSRSLVSRVRVPPAPLGSAWGGGPDILELLGSVVLLRRPRTVVETGVATGFSTAVILAAMSDNDRGVLHSIDLPPLQVEATSFVGVAVPRDLRDRWRLHVGPARTVLPVLLGELPPIDLFVHDSDHSYAAQYDEYWRAWPHLAVGACLISDDVCNPAFTDFAEQVGERPYLIAPPRHDAAVGLLVKTR